jgi:hypothetical protein
MDTLSFMYMWILSAVHQVLLSSIILENDVSSHLLMHRFRGIEAGLCKMLADVGRLDPRQALSARHRQKWV